MNNLFSTKPVLVLLINTDPVKSNHVSRFIYFRVLRYQSLSRIRTYGFTSASERTFLNSRKYPGDFERIKEAVNRRPSSSNPISREPLRTPTAVMSYRHISRHCFSIGVSRTSRCLSPAKFEMAFLWIHDVIPIHRHEFYARYVRLNLIIFSSKRYPHTTCIEYVDIFRKYKFFLWFSFSIRGARCEYLLQWWILISSLGTFI